MPSLYAFMIVVFITTGCLCRRSANMFACTICSLHAGEHHKNNFNFPHFYTRDINIDNRPNPKVWQEDLQQAVLPRPGATRNTASRDLLSRHISAKGWSVSVLCHGNQNLYSKVMLVALSFFLDLVLVMNLTSCLNAILTWHRHTLFFT